MSDQVDMKQILGLLVGGETLTESQAHDAFECVMTGNATDAQIGALLTAISCRPNNAGPSVDEIVGAATVMREHATKVSVPEGMDVIDTCGTGGDHSGTFNVSTVAALIAAGAGAKVAKHGNRSITSKSGSSQVLEALGVNLQITPDLQTKCLEEAGICFCFAPAHHPAMKHAIGPRQQLGFRTIFNVLGPLTNPAGAKRQVMGVYSPTLTAPIARVLQRMGSQRVMVVHGSGMDEITTVGSTQISELKDGEVRTYNVTPEELGLTRSSPDDLLADGVEDSAAVIRSILHGEQSHARNIAVVNAAAALVVAGVADSLAVGIQAASQSIDKGAAKQVLYKLVELTTADANPVDLS